MDQEIFVAIVNSFTDSILTTDYSGKILNCNRSTEDLFNAPSASLVGSKIFNLFAKEDNKEIKRSLTILTKEQPTGVTHPVSRKFFVAEAQLMVEVKRIAISERAFLLFHLVAHKDAIEEADKQDERRSLEIVKTRNEFFSIMSHEIRTPMNAILGMSEVLLRRNPRNDQTKLLQLLQFSSKNLLSIINDILDFSKIESGKMTVEAVNFNIKLLVENIVQSLGPRVEEKYLKISYEISELIPEVISGDYIKLSQILNNLLSNAIKFTSKGNIEVSIGLDKFIEEGYIIKFDVKDTGIGIAKDKIATIFDPFHQATESTTRVYGGTGLGLSIVKNLVNLQNGSIEVESEEQVGSVFSVKLPFKHADKSMPVNSFISSSKREFKWKLNLHVLYVEDVATNQFLIKEIFDDWGINVDMAVDGNEALKLIHGKSYDLILMDIQLPGIDGLETARRIREMKDPYFKNIPIIALSATSSTTLRAKIECSGMQDFILKPINVDDLRTKIVEHSRVIGEYFESEQANNKASEETDQQKIIFERTDRLFLSNLINYQEFLKMTINEFKYNLELMIVSIKEENVIEYRQLRHRMKSLIVMFGIDDLLILLNEIKEKLVLGKLSSEEKKSFIKSLKYQVQFLIDGLTNKLASLKWQ